MENSQELSPTTVVSETICCGPVGAVSIQLSKPAQTDERMRAGAHGADPVIGGNSGIEAGPEHFPRPAWLAKNIFRFCFLRAPGLWAFREICPARPQTILFGQERFMIPRRAPGSRGSSKASILRVGPPVPGRGAAARSDSRRS